VSSVTSNGIQPPEKKAAVTRGRVSIRDVARRAGVAQGTVSHVLNHPERVSPARREAVEKAMTELGFVRHEAARQLRSGQSTTLGLVLLDAWNPSFQDMARGVEEVTRNGGWNVLLSNSARDLDRERIYLRLFSEARVAGLIVIPHDEHADGLHQIRAGGVPVVVLDRAEDGEHALSVSVDDVAGGRLAAQHLLELGHRRIAFMGDPNAATPVHDRFKGVLEAVEAVSADLEVLTCALTMEAGRQIGEQLARRAPSRRPTAVVAAIDIVAIGALYALEQAGVSVPNDLSLVGYDDIPFNSEMNGPLTTVRRPHHEMGAAAAELLLAAVAGREVSERHLVFEPTLIVRRSTAKPPDRRTKA
jgi:LacI family transcriptional regulator